jgi:3-phenylpropionate/trans-cinnamate dioxygenase ferredoxin reductase subunit
MSALGNIVIVGAGQAGGRCAHALREFGYTGRIMLIGDEAEHPYERPPLSKALLGPAAATTRIHLHALESYAQRGIELMLGRRVARLLPKRRELILDDETVLGYDRCILATGGRARMWPGRLSGNGGRVVTLRSVHDAHALRERLNNAKRVAIIGGGFLGLECADAACSLGLDVTVIESGDRLLPGKLPTALGAQLQHRHTDRGVTFRLGDEVEYIVDEDGASEVHVQLKSGEDVAADVCLVAIGQVPNDALAVEAGLETGNGIHVDACCRTSAADVYAAGDCASFPFGLDARRIRLESWQNAEQQSRVAAANAFGMNEMYSPLPWFWTDQTGWNFQFLGMQDATAPDPEWLVRRTPDSANERSVWLSMRGNVIAAAVAVNSGGDMQPLRKLIGSAARLDRALLLDPSVRLSTLSKSQQ